jgi:hypothetical protein
MNNKIINMVFFAFLATFAGTAYATHYQSVEEMVAAQPTIRVIMDATPGFGNQAASVNMMNRLWSMHFNGTYEVIYPDYLESEVNKIIDLFNLPKELPKVYHYEDKQHHKITFIAESEYDKQLINHQVVPVKIGVTGGRDYQEVDSCLELPECAPSARNFAKFLNADAFIYMQPWFALPDQDAVVTKQSDDKIQIVPPGKYLVYPSADYIDAKTYLADDAAGREFIANKPALRTLIDGVDNKRFNLLPLYGYTFRKGEERDLIPVFPTNIMQALTGARYAVMNGSQEMKKPLIIAVFYDYKSESNEIMQLLQRNNWGDYEEQGAEQMRAAIAKTGLNKPNVLLTASLDDADTARKIQALQPGQILLLSMGVLPKVVFDGFYAHQADNIWAAMREGEGTLSMLIMKGRPHLRCGEFAYRINEGALSKWEPRIESVQDEKLRARLDIFYGEHGFCGGNSWILMPDIYEEVGAFLIEGNDKNSAFSRYFAELHQDSQKQANDRIYRALEVTLKLVNSTK